MFGFLILLEYLLCCMALVVSSAFFGRVGTIAYICVAVVVANIQVLKLVDVPFFDFPFAWGTITFASTFMASDIVVEFYGKKNAIKATLLSFLMSFFSSVVMLITITLPTFDEVNNFEIQKAIELIFNPSPRILASSLLSYFIAQYADITIFQFLKDITRGRFLWFRSTMSLCVSALIDNIVFSTLCWFVFTNNPVSVETLLKTYIFGTYYIRIIMALIQIPVIYSIKYLISKRLVD